MSGNNTNELHLTAAVEDSIVHIDTMDTSSDTKKRPHIQISADVNVDGHNDGHDSDRDSEYLVELLEGAIAEGLVRANENDIERTVSWLLDQGICKLSVLKSYPVDYLASHICYPLVMAGITYESVLNDSDEPAPKTQKTKAGSSPSTSPRRRKVHTVEEIRQKIMERYKEFFSLPDSFVVLNTRCVECKICKHEINLKSEGNLSRIREHVLGKYSKKRTTLVTLHKKYLDAKVHKIANIGPKVIDRKTRKEKSLEAKAVLCYCQKPAVITQGKKRLWRCGNKKKTCLFACSEKVNNERINDYECDSDGDEVDGELINSVTNSTD